MKSLSRVFVFLLALMVGIVGAGVAVWEGKTELCPTFVSTSTGNGVVALPEVSVVFVGIGHDNSLSSETVLRFQVTNNTDTPVSYWAHRPNYPFSQAVVDGQALKYLFRCGTGMMEHTIAPRASTEFNVGVWDFEVQPAGDSLVQIGFALKRANTPESDTYYSQSFALPKEFRQAIRRK